MVGRRYVILLLCGPTLLGITDRMSGHDVVSGVVTSHVLPTGLDVVAAASEMNRRASANSSSSSNEKTGWAQQQQQQRLPPLPQPHGEDPHLVFEDDLRYRRVCAHVHLSVLCLIVRFPFEMPLQDATVSFPKPVNPQFYKISDSYILDGTKLENCRLRQQQQQQQQHSLQQQADNHDIHDYNDDDPSSSSFMSNVKQCLEAEAAQASTATAVALFTRQTRDGSISLFGTRSPEQRARAHSFFGNHNIILLGASPTPGVANGLAQLFDSCNSTGAKEQSEKRLPPRLLGYQNRLP